MGSVNNSENPLSIQNHMSPKVLRASYVNNSFIKSPGNKPQPLFVTSRQIELDPNQPILSLQNSKDLKENIHTENMRTSAQIQKRVVRRGAGLSLGDRELRDKKQIEKVKKLMLKQTATCANKKNSAGSFIVKEPFKECKVQNTVRYRSPDAAQKKVEYKAKASVKRENKLKKIVIIGDCDRSNSVSSQKYRVSRRLSNAKELSVQQKRSSAVTHSLEVTSGRLIQHNRSNRFVSPYGQTVYLRAKNGYSSHSEYKNSAESSQKRIVRVRSKRREEQVTSNFEIEGRKAVTAMRY
jgi:hypothetical protein